MGRSLPTASVIICSYDELRWPIVLECLQRVACQSVPPSEVILVVDHNDGLFERASKSVPGEVAVVNNTGPRGAGAARNAGVAASSAEILVFLDDDAIPAP